VNDAGGTYNGSSFPATFTIAGVDNKPGSSLEGVPVTVTYKDASGNTLAGAPKNAGNYTVQELFPGSRDYASASLLTNFKVDPRPMAVTAVATIVTYNGTTSSPGVPTITAGSLAPGDTANCTES